MDSKDNTSVESSLISIKESLESISKSVKPKEKKFNYFITILWTGFGIIAIYLLYLIWQFLNKM